MSRMPSDVKAEFAKLSDAPVRAIVYTHAHPDHTGGAAVFAGDNRPDIFVHQLFVDRVADVGRADRDGGDQFGSTLPDSLFINVGTGMEFGRRTAATAFLAPTRDVQWRPPGSDNRRRSTATPSHTGRDTREHGDLAPDRGVLLPGDNFYRAFPNLYAIRGARLRPIDQWVTSLSTSSALERSTSCRDIRVRSREAPMCAPL